jgi:hypothetical protein
VADCRVTCINKANRQSIHESITHLGGNGWKLTRQQVIDRIDGHTDTFYTLVNGKRANVGVVRHRPHDYVQTYADGQWNNNLLSLPECL